VEIIHSQLTVIQLSPNGVSSMFDLDSLHGNDTTTRISDPLSSTRLIGSGNIDGFLIDCQ
jgi:hypothetical protein